MLKVKCPCGTEIEVDNRIEYDSWRKNHVCSIRKDKNEDPIEDAKNWMLPWILPKQQKSD